MNTLIAEFTTPGGQDRKFILPVLSNRDFHRVLYTSGTTLLSSLAAIEKGGGKPPADYDVFIDVAKSLMNGMVIDGVGQIDDIEQHEYFRKYPEELYLGTFHALRMNYPELFLRLQAAIAKSGLFRRVAGENSKSENEKLKSPSPTGSSESTK